MSNRHKSADPRRQSGPRATSPDGSGGSRQLAGWRLWLGRGAIALALPAVLLAVAEGGLRLARFGYPTGFLITAPVSSGWTENRRFLYQFYTPRTNLRPNPFVASAPRPEDSVRLVVLGESAAAGTPDPAYNFGRILERMLRHENPARRVEVINAAMNGINSHIILPVACDCARLQPDLFIVYMGNNEAVGLHAPGPHSGEMAGHLRLLRTAQWARATRLGQLLAPLFQRLDPESAGAQEQDAAFFERHRVAADDPRRAPIYANFRSNLADICSAAERAGAGVVLMTVAVNLKDCPPFGSLHRAGLSATDQARWETEYAAGAQAETAGQPALALGRFMAAAAVDDHFAELHFRLARCYQALEQSARTREEFGLARDLDALPFRTDSKINEIVRQIARAKREEEKPGIIKLVDAERLFAEAEPGGVPGERLFVDHVHPTFAGDYLLAKALLPVVRQALSDRSKAKAQVAKAIPAILSLEECAAQLAFTRVNEWKTAQEMAQTTALPPFTSQLEHAQRQRRTEQVLKEEFGNMGAQDFEVAAATYREAMRQSPEDWRLKFNYGQLLLMGRDFSGAVPQFAAAKQRMPHWVPLRVALGVALRGAGRQREALDQLREALVLEPESDAVKAGIKAME